MGRFDDDILINLGEDPNPPIFQRLMVALGYSPFDELTEEHRAAIDAWLESNTPGQILRIQLARRGFEVE